jgi:hypothetical protein
MMPIPSCVSSTVTALGGANLEPSFQARGVSGVQRVQNKRRQRKVTDPVHLARDGDLLQVVTVDFVGGLGQVSANAHDYGDARF